MYSKLNRIAIPLTPESLEMQTSALITSTGHGKRGALSPSRERGESKSGFHQGKIQCLYAARWGILKTDAGPNMEDKHIRVWSSQKGESVTIPRGDFDYLLQCLS